MLPATTSTPNIPMVHFRMTISLNFIWFSIKTGFTEGDSSYNTTITAWEHSTDFNPKYSECYLRANQVAGLVLRYQHDQFPVKTGDFQTIPADDGTVFSLV